MDPRGIIRRIYKDDHYTLLHTKYESSGLCGLGEEDFFYVSPIVSLWELMTPGVGPFLTPGAWLAGFIQRTTIHCYTQNMKALGFVVSEKKILFMFFPCCHQSMAPMDPRGIICRIYKEDHYTLLHTKYESSRLCGFGEEDFVYVFPMSPQERGPYGPQGHNLQDL